MKLILLCLLGLAAGDDTVYASHSSKLCLNAEERKNGAKVQLTACDSASPNQAWTRARDQIRLKDTNFCLNLPKTEEKNNGKLELWTCNGNNDHGEDTQKWNVKCDNGEKCQLTAAYTGGKCGGTDCCVAAQGSIAKVWQCGKNGPTHPQKFAWTENNHVELEDLSPNDPRLDLPQTGLIRKAGGKCMNADIVTKTVSMGTCDISEMNTWTVHTYQGAPKQIKLTRTDYCLYLPKANEKNNGLLKIAECDGNDHGENVQKFEMTNKHQISASYTGGKCGGKKCCLNLPNNKADDTPLKVWGCSNNGHPDDKWIIDSKKSNKRYHCALTCAVQDGRIIVTHPPGAIEEDRDQHRCYKHDGGCTCVCLSNFDGDDAWM